MIGAKMTPSPIERSSHARRLAPQSPTVHTIQYMDMQSLLQFCQMQLKKTDEIIMSSMKNLQGITELQEELVKLKSLDITPNKALALDRLGAQLTVQQGKEKLAKGSETVTDEKTGKVVDRRYTDADRAAIQAEIDAANKRIADIDALAADDFMSQVEATAAKLDAAGQPEVATALRNEAKRAASGKKEDLDGFRKSVDAQIQTLGASREMSMVHLQAHVAQRGTMLQMTTNMISALGKTADQIATNLGR
jgi:hypothetical protein